MRKFLRRFILKSLYVVASIKYPKMRWDLRYFIRDNWYCKMRQVKFLLSDYVLKKEYKVINYEGEFDQELRYVIPFAYWHHLNGTLKKTISARNTKEFYFFSKNHEERYEKRVWTKTYDYYDVPNMTHSNSYSFKKWKTVPYKDFYSNDTFKYGKPTLVIANKYNIEWDQPPVNFFDIATLDAIITQQKHKYQIVYNRPLSGQIVLDNSEILDLNEHDWIRKNHPEVILMEDLFQKHHNEVNNYNHLQLLVYANCSNFISIHGGTAVLASCFGGQNIILSNPAWGIEIHFNEYQTIVPALSGAKIYHAKKREDIFPFLEKYY